MKYLILCVMILASGSAWGACEKKDIQGIYILYIASGITTGTASICSIGVKRRGKIIGGKCSDLDEVSYVEGGRLRLERDCTITGVIKTDRGPALIPLASMDRGKGMITGNILVRDGVHFTAVKHEQFGANVARYFER